MRSRVPSFIIDLHCGQLYQGFTFLSTVYVDELHKIPFLKNGSQEFAKFVFAYRISLPDLEDLLLILLAPPANNDQTWK